MAETTATSDGRQARARLHGMRFDFVSIVDRPDNPPAAIELLKREGGADSDANPTPTTSEPTMGHMSKRTGQETASEPDATTAVDNGDGETYELPEPVIKYIENLEAYVDQLEAKVVSKHDDTDDGDDVDDDSDVDDDEDGEDEEIGKSAPTFEEILKSNPAIAAEFAKRDKALAAANAVALEAATIAKAEREQRLAVAFAKRAEALPNLGLTVEDGADLLKRAFDACGNDLYNEIEGVLAKANTTIDQLKRNSTTEIGKADTRTNLPAGIEALMAPISKTANGTVSDQDLIAAAAADPAAYERYVNSILGGN